MQTGQHRLRGRTKHGQNDKAGTTTCAVGAGRVNTAAVAEAWTVGSRQSRSSRRRQGKHTTSGHQHRYREEQHTGSHKARSIQQDEQPAVNGCICMTSKHIMYIHAHKTCVDIDDKATSSNM